MNLNPQLNLLFEIIQKEKPKKIADIGSDHGLLPEKLIETNYSGIIYPTDLSVSAINNLKTKFLLNKNIICLQGDGLKVFKQEKIDLIIIAGLGSETILKILEDDQILFEKYCIQTMHNPVSIRKWIQSKKYFLENEFLIEHRNHFYHTIIINKNNGIKIESENDILFGPLLSKEKKIIFKKYWNQKNEKLEKLLKVIPIKEKKAIIKLKINKIKKILKYC